MATGLGLFAGIPTNYIIDVTTSAGLGSTQTFYTCPTNKVAYIQMQWAAANSAITWTITPILRMIDTFSSTAMDRNFYTAGLAVAAAGRTAFDSLTLTSVKPSSTERLDNNLIRLYGAEKLMCTCTPSANNGSLIRVTFMVIEVG